VKNKSIVLLHGMSCRLQIVITILGCSLHTTHYFKLQFVNNSKIDTTGTTKIRYALQAFVCLLVNVTSTQIVRFVMG